MIDSELLKGLTTTIQHNHECESEYIRTETVVEKKAGKVLWEADVEVFKLKGHDEAKKCYGWTVDQDNKMDYVTVLNLPPVDSAKKAVQHWISKTYTKKS